MSDHYAVLGVAPDATSAEVAAAFRTAARRAHPDMGGSAEEFAEVALAWEVLADPTARAAYDLARAPVDAWSDVGWGATTASPGPSGDDDEEAVADGPLAPWWTTDEHDADAPDGAVALDDPTLPRRRRGGLDPFRGPAVAFPPPSPRPLTDFVPPRWRAPVMLAAAVVAVVVAAPVTGLTSVAMAPNAAAGSLRPIAVALVGMLGVVVLLAAGRALVRHWVEHPSGRAAVQAPAWFGLAVVALLVRGPLLLAIEVVVLTAVAAAALEARRRAQNWQVHARQRRNAAFAEAIAARTKADRWNALRAAADVPGARIVRIGKKVRGERRRRRVRAVGALRSRVHEFTDFAQEGWWAAIDEHGDVVALAPGDAPRHWSAAAKSARRPELPADPDRQTEAATASA